MKAVVKFLFVAVLLSLGFNHSFMDVKAAQNEPIVLGFNPEDTAIDPEKPFVYMTKLGSKMLYEVNFSTGEMKTLPLPYPAERLEYFNVYLASKKCYKRQLKM